MNNATIGNQQMELGLGSGGRAARAVRRQRRLSRAHWWFERMRAAVDGALNWEPAPRGRPEQIWFSETQRQIRISRLAPPGEPDALDCSSSQVCE